MDGTITKIDGWMDVYKKYMKIRMVGSIEIQL